MRLNCDQLNILNGPQHGEGDLMVLFKFKMLTIMTILRHQYDFNSYKTY
jgi:hypothetical protein